MSRLMSNSLLKKCFAIMLSVILMFGCSFAPCWKNTAYAITDGETSEQQFIEYMLDPDGNNQTWWYKEDMEDPYGYGKDKPFMMTQQNEVAYILKSTSSDHNWSNIGANYPNGNTSSKFPDKFSDHDDSIKSEMPDAVTKMDSCHIVGFSPAYNNNPREDHVAVIGYFDNGGKHDVCLAVYNATAKKWSSVSTIGNIDWIDSSGKTYYGDLEPNMSITAGDYNGDGKDSIVTYFANYSSDNYGICEWTVTDKSDGTPEISKTPSSKDSDFNLLNQDFAYDKGSHMKEIYDTSGHKAAGKGSLRATLKTGDFNGDNIDDVAVLSALEFETSDQAKKWGYRMDVPYLGICKGTNKGNFLSEKPIYSDWVVNESATDKTKAETVNLENFTVARLGKHSADSIIVGGNHSTQSPQSNSTNWGDSWHGGGLAMARYDYNGSSIKQSAYTTKCMLQSGDIADISINGFSKKGNYKGSYAWSPICAETVYMCGKGNDPYILMDGDLYHWKENSNTPQRVFEVGYLNDADDGVGSAIIDQNYCGVATTCAGCWDGNAQGYEQVVFSLVRRQKDSDDYFVSFYTIGMKDNMHDPDTGLPMGVKEVSGQSYDMGYKDDLFFWANDGSSCYIDNKGSTRDHGICFAFCNMDYKNDGLCTKLSNQGLVYSDPVLECALQASPYYNTFNDTYTKFTNVNENSEGVAISDETTQGKGFSLSKSKETSKMGAPDDSGNSKGGGVKKETNLKAGSVSSYTLSFSGKIGKAYTNQWSSSSNNSIVVRRYPFMYFNYAVQNNEDPSDWSGEVCATAMKNDQILGASLSTKAYNEFVQRYNDELTKTDTGEFTKLVPITESDLTENIGDPSAYKNLQTYNDTYGCCDSSFDYSTSPLAKATTFYAETSSCWEKQRGLKFEYDKSYTLSKSKKNDKGITRTKSFGIGKYQDYQEMWGISKEVEKSEWWTVTWQHKSPTSGAVFSCRPGCWLTTVAINHDEAGNEINFLPVYGYLTLNAESPSDIPKPPTNPRYSEINSGQYQSTAVTNGSGANTPNANNSESGNSGTNTPNANNSDSGISSSDNQSTQDNSFTQSNTADSTTKPASFGFTQKAYADENDADKRMVISWDVDDNSKNYKHQIYTSVNGEIVKFGDPVSGTELVLDPNNISESAKSVLAQLESQEIPILQFAVSSISEKGIEGPMSEWIYVLPSKYFSEKTSFSVLRNSSDDCSRLSLSIKRGDSDQETINADSLRFERSSNSDKKAVLAINGVNGENQTRELELNDGSKYKFDSIEPVAESSDSCLYSVKFANSNNASDVKNCIVKIDDGRFANERIAEKMVLSNWKDADEVKNALENPDTRDEASNKIEQVSNTLSSAPGSKLSGEAKDIYKTGVKTYFKVNGHTVSGLSGAGSEFGSIIVAIAAAVVVFAAILISFRFSKKKKNH